MPIKIAGFQIYGDSNGIYILPVYSFRCSCNLKLYITETAFPSEETHYTRIFRPKYLKKYKQLRLVELNVSKYFTLIPHITIDINNMSRDPCCVTLVEPTPMLNFFLVIRRNQQHSRGSQIYEMCDSLLEDIDCFDIEGYRHLCRFIMDYWAHSNYGWYSSLGPKFRLSFPEVKALTDSAVETKLFKTFNENTDKFETEMKSAMNLLIIPPLINIICAYGHSMIDTMGKIISIVHQDILHYGMI